MRLGRSIPEAKWLPILASVEKGLLGSPPKTAWLIGYGLLERVYCRWVAGYDPYGNAGHQLLTRLYMDFLRMEGESNFLRLLPAEAFEGGELGLGSIAGGSKHNAIPRDASAIVVGTMR